MPKLEDIKKIIDDELCNVGIDNEKSRKFLVDLFDRRLSAIEFKNIRSIKRIIRRCAILIRQVDFPYAEHGGRLFFLPIDNLIDTILYTEKNLTLFFIQFISFYLLLCVLYELYPDCFKFLSNPPFLVPSSSVGDMGEKAKEILKQYLGWTGIKGNMEGEIESIATKDKLLFMVLKMLCKCNYLALGANYDAHNKTIFTSVKSGVPV